jgi:hypothetical protein
MKMRSLLAAVVGLGLVAATTSPPSGNRYFYQSSPPNPLLIQLLGRSHISLLADLFWIRTIGVSVNLKVPADGRLLIAWCGLVTDLDHHFVWPYIFGGLLGPTPSADLANWYNVKEGDALLAKGEANIPDDFRLPLYLSYNQLQLEHDTTAAAQTLRNGALRPGAPLVLAQLATRLLAQTDAFEAAHDFAAQLEESATDPTVREFFEHRRLEIERDQMLDALQRGVDAFRQARGQVPASLMQLLSEGFVQQLPADPLGGEFLLGADGVVSSTSGARLKAHFQTGVP